MTYRRSFALAFVTICTACGSSGGSGEIADVGPEQPEFNEQAPDNGYEQPVDTFGETPQSTEQPDFNDDAPPGGSSPPLSSGGGVNPTCQDICGAFISAGCIEDQPGECLAECSNPDSELAPCINEYLMLLGCVVSSPQFVCVDGELDVDIDELFANCPSETDAYLACDGTIEPQPQPDPGPTPTDCTLAGGCSCGTDICQTCLCAYSGDATMCVDFCG